jgi:alkylation response protein AidB-like acyl-CoA dehydrogenase
MAIDFSLSESQVKLQADTRNFANQVLTQVKAAIANIARPEDRFYAIRPFYEKMIEAGFAKALIPVEYGGTGMTAVDFAIAAEELAAVDINVPSALLATGLGLEPIIRYGSIAQKREFLTPYAATSGSRLAALAFTEVTGGANADSPDPSVGVRTFARRDGDYWVINGQKHYTTNGTGWDGKGADLFSVVCRTDPDKPPQESMAIIVVPGDSAGIEIAGILDTVGHRAVVSPRIHFNEVRVPVGNLIGQPGDGLAITAKTFAWTAALIGATCTGVMRAAFDCAFEFAKHDYRSGPVPVIEYQNAGYMLADLKMRIEASRYLAWKACHYLDTTDGEGLEMAVIAKVYCSELSVQVVYDAMRLVGVDSYTDMTPLAGLMQDALCFPLYDGGNMGVRRRQLHNLFRAPGYDPMAAAEGRLGPRG